MTAPPLSDYFPFADIIQYGFVARDLDEAMAIFAARYGITRFASNRGSVVQVMGEGVTAELDSALALVGRLEIEILVPRGGHDHVYRDALSPAGPPVVLHHLAQRAATPAAFDRAAAGARAQGLQIALRGELHGIRYLYVDCRAVSGHYIEHLYRPPEVEAAFLAETPNFGRDPA
jgi:hypothetical protein